MADEQVKEAELTAEDKAVADETAEDKAVADEVAQVAAELLAAEEEQPDNEEMKDEEAPKGQPISGMVD